MPFKAVVPTLALLLALGPAMAGSVRSQRHIQGHAERGALVVIVNEQTNAVTRVRADARGAFFIGPLASGVYVLFEQSRPSVRHRLVVGMAHDAPVDLRTP